ncbi:MAG: hypothetical protein M3512_15035 [Bacteroidota bacterium]|nr:hypothetical protein [Bacteroidota bacterium]
MGGPRSGSPIELWSVGVVDNKVDYPHNNKVIAGFINEPRHWRYGSAIHYSGGKGILKVDFKFLPNI